MRDTRTALRYLLAAGLTILVLGVASIILAVCVDSYRMFGTRGIEGWSALKPRAYQQSDLAKSYMLLRIRPRTLLLGNSRVEVGIDPQSAAWPARLKPVFNAAEAGHDLFTALLFLQQDIALKPPTLVVLGVDFQDFISSGDDPADPPVGPNEIRMLVDRNGMPSRASEFAYWEDAHRSTLTIDAISDTILTLASQNVSSGVTMRADGFNPLHEYRAAVRSEGAYSLFAQKQAAYLAQYSGFHASDFRLPQQNPQFRYLARILLAAAAHKCTLIIFIYPYHVRYLEMLHQLGLWQSFEAWKRALTAMVDQARQSDGAAVHLIDFSDYDSASEERVPPSSDRHTQLQWYWEPGHFKSALGDRLIANMLGNDQDFGSPLTGANIESVLVRINEDRAQYLDEKPSARKGSR